MNTTENSIKTNRLNRYKTDEEIKTIKTAEQRLNEHLIENSSKIEEEENREDILNEASNLLELQSDFQNQLSNNYGSIINRLRTQASHRMK